MASVVLGGGARGPELLGIQYLRAAAAAMVVIDHMSVQLNRHGGFPLLYRLESGVDIFFVVSGFIMMYATGNGTSVSPGGFLKRRVLRVAPLYWVVTAFSVALLLAVPSIAQTARLDWLHVTASLLFIPMLNPGVPWMYYPLVIPAWTLLYEMAFYLLFALAMVPARGNPRVLIVLLVTAMTAIVVAGQIWQPGGVLRFYANPIILEFAAGACLGMTAHRVRLSPGAGVVLCVLSVMAIMMPVVGEEGRDMRVIHYGIPAVVMVFAMANTPVAAWRLPSLLGDSSYSMYLVHAFIVSAMGQVGARLGLFGSTSAGIAALTLSYVVSAAAGVVIWSVVERPMNEALRRRFLRARRRDATVAGGPPARETPPVALVDAGSALFTSVR